LSEAVPQLGYVAFLDVLGFTAMVANDRDGERLEQYLNTLKTALKDDDGHTVEYVVFSDSIVLTERNLETMLRTCSRLFWSMLRQLIPVRGAIAYGPYIRNEVEGRGVFVAGRALIDAYEYEGRQDWVGIMLAPSLVMKHPDLSERCKLVRRGSNQQIMDTLRANLTTSAVIQPSEIPFRDGSRYQGLAVVPTAGEQTPGPVRQSVEEAMHALQRMQRYAPDPSSQAKYIRAIEWLNILRGQWEQMETTWGQVMERP
jgi:hypothetical protein